MIRDVLLGIGLLLSTASQLRLSGVPMDLGPGELLLAIWLLLALVDLAIRPVPRLTPGLARLLIFWTVFTFALSLGTLVGLAIEEVRDTPAAMRTAKAYLLAALISCFAMAMPNAELRLRRVVWTAVTFGGLAFTVMLLGAYRFVHVPGLEFWVYNRFIGWSTNPNQFALLCIVLVHLSLHLAETSDHPRAKLFALSCGVLVFLAGILTRSDSFILAMLVVGPLLFGIKILGWAIAAEQRSSMRTVAACLMIFSVPALLIAAAPFAPAISDKARAVAIETMEKNDQAEGRFELWRDSMEVGLKSGLLGLGPGPHLVTKQWKQPPPEKNEAHNTTFDLLTQGGIIAMLSFFGIMAAAFFAAYRLKLVGLTTLVISLFVFSNFHLIARHPVFWFSIALCLATADTLRSPKTRRNEVPGTP